MRNPEFALKLLAWYEKNKRDLPWRKTKDPYLIWLSEIILQQTRVKQGLPYYQKFVEQYPTLRSLAQAEEREVLRLWQGLGYYSRARNMHHTAQYLVKEKGGEFPKNYKGLLQLRGIGPYTAAAIASFAFQEKVAVVDGNVYRVLARVFNVSTDISSYQGGKEFQALATQLLPDEQSHIYNQAMMEFGAMHCSPLKPNCLFCPLQNMCEAFALGKQAELPVKNQKTKVRPRYFHYLIWQCEGLLAMKPRRKKIYGKVCMTFSCMKQTLSKRLIKFYKAYLYTKKTFLLESLRNQKYTTTH